MEKKPRSEAQKAADRRYRETHPDIQKSIQFMLPSAEAIRLSTYFATMDITKADFLRLAVKAHKDGKF